jgi:hypothetical protein
MQKKRIKDFNSFVNESYHNDIDEGIFSTNKKYGKIHVFFHNLYTKFFK